jgi:oligoendopeptidase F
MDLRVKRSYLPDDFKVEDWKGLEPYFDELQRRELGNREEFMRWMKDLSELESALQEELGRSYIKMTCFTGNEEYRERFNYIISEIEPQVSPRINELNRRIADYPELDAIKMDGFDVMIRGIRNDLELFREENIPLKAKIQQLQSKYGEITGPLGIEHNGQELTLPQASNLLFSTDRDLREEVYQKVTEARLEVENQLDDLFDEMIPVRQKIAENAGFENFRDYMFRAKGRFDYSPNDCKTFHEAVRKEVVPLLNDIAGERKEKLGLKTLRPWDLKVDKSGKAALRPFNDSDELINKSVSLFDRIDPFFGDCLRTMKEMGHLDLESRKNKAPGGYNYPLDEIGVPFIFMNATSTFRDMITLMHEGGHAVHSFLTRDYDFLPFKHPTSEVAELASMSMELISMDFWDEFFQNEEEMWRAKEEHLEQIIETLPWVAVIDKFQHWIYENPNHSREDRSRRWVEIFDEFRSPLIDYSDLDDSKRIAWHKQLHIFEVPFYYIEYAIAQLGAIGVWINYRENPKQALEQYTAGLKLGYTKPIPEIYKTAGVQFDFSADYISKLVNFVNEELRECRAQLNK